MSIISSKKYLEMIVVSKIAIYVLFSLIFLLSIISNANAQNNQDILDAQLKEDIKRLEQEEKNKIEKIEKENRIDGGKRKSSVKSKNVVPNTSTGKCFNIKEITISGHEVFGAPPNNYDYLRGECVKVEDIVALLNILNTTYQEQGFITTRVYAPEQELADGTLELVVIPGIIERYEYADGTPIDRRVKWAFPAKEGDIVDLRELEQGLDNFNSLKSQQGKFQLHPGKESGDSLVVIAAKEASPLHFDFSLDNSGFDTTGVYKLDASVTIDNILNSNDKSVIQINTTPGVRRSEKYSDSYNLNFSIPYKNMNFSTNMGFSEYLITQKGVNQDFLLEGESLNVSIGAENLLARDKNYKVYAMAGLKHYRKDNKIAGVKILSQRRRLAIGNFGLRGKYYLDNSEIGWNLKYKRGLDIWGSEKPFGTNIDHLFEVYTAGIDYKYASQNKRFTFYSEFFGQDSSDNLPGSEQISIGGQSSVRGFHAENMYGNSGFYLKNTVELEVFKNETTSFKNYIGIDYGKINIPDNLNWSQSYLTGISIGGRLKFGDNVNIEMSYSSGISKPNEFDKDEGVYLFKVTLGL